MMFFLLLGILSIGLSRAYADIEIDLGDSNPTPVPTASSQKQNLADQTNVTQAASPQQNQANQAKAVEPAAAPVSETTASQEAAAEEPSSEGETAVENEGTTEIQTD